MKIVNHASSDNFVIAYTLVVDDLARHLQFKAMEMGVVMR
jgi:hypothetical protein